MKFVWPLLAIIWLIFLGFGTGKVPALGPMLDLHSGIWSHRPHRLSSQPLPGLRSSVTVAWDKNGVPHIFAADEADLYRAQGFVMASQRLFQMDLSTRQPAGKLSEWVGDKTLPMDRFQVLFGMRHSIQATTDEFLKDDGNVSMLNNFIGGVNAYIDSKPNLPPEYTLLEVHPQHFTVDRVIAMDKVLTFSLAGRSQALQLSALQQKLGVEKILDLFPEFLPSEFEDFIMPQWPGPRRAPERAGDFPFVTQLREIPKFPLPNPGKGSNNWAVGPAKSSTGHTLFANDTHLGYSLPNVWYEQQLACPAFNVYGVSLVSIPGIVNGFNGRVAWGPTNGTTPVLDWYEVEFENEGSNRYRWGGDWIEAMVEHESIAVKGSAPVLVDVVWTKHGPIVHREGRLGLAANWMGHRPGNELSALRGLYAANNAQECIRSFRDHWRVPIQNFICADDEHLVLRHSGRMPQRKIGEGRFIMDGRATRDTLGEVIPEQDVPELSSPADGIMLSANQKIEGPSYPYYLGWDYEEPFRAMMIRRRLHEKEKYSPEDMIRIQNDSHDLQAELALPSLLKALNTSGMSADQIAVIDRLRQWDYSARAETAEPALYKAWFRQFREAIAEGANPKEIRAIWLLKRLSQNPSDSDAQWLKGSLGEVVTASFREAWDGLNQKMGSDYKSWTWARYNGAELPHIARLPGWGSGILSMDGSGESIRGDHDRHGPVYKAVFALGPEPKIWMQVPGGNEGDPFHPDFGRFVNEWSAGEMRPVEYYKDEAEAKAKAVRVIQLTPANGG